MAEKLHTKGGADNSKIRKNAVGATLCELKPVVEQITGCEAGGEFFVINGRSGVLETSTASTSEQPLGVLGCLEEASDTLSGWGTSVAPQDAASDRPLITLFSKIEEENFMNRLENIEIKQICEESEDFLYDLLSIELKAAEITEGELVEWARFVKLLGAEAESIQDLSRDALVRILRSWSSICGLIHIERSSSSLVGVSS